MESLSVSVVSSAAITGTPTHFRGVAASSTITASLESTAVRVRQLSVQARVGASIVPTTTVRTEHLIVSARAFSGVAISLTTHKRSIVASATTRALIEEASAPLAVWVMNIETGGFTRYEGFNFNSYARIGNSYYGCAEDGIYQLDGDTDNGEPIRAMVSFGKQNFGTTTLKRITNAYIGVSGQGRMFLKVMAEGQEYTYAARSYDEHLQVQRIDTGKGLRVNWLEFELYSADGEGFELASVEFAAVPLSRRI